MRKQRINTREEFDNWYTSSLATFPVVIEGGGGLEPPTNYPCIMVYDFIEKPYFECFDEEQDFDAFRSEGYCSDEIEKFIYHYVYLTDFK